MSPKLEELAARFEAVASYTMDAKREAVRAEAWEKGKAEGMKQGLSQGMKQGLAEGKAEGIDLTLNYLYEIGRLAKEDLETLKQVLSISAEKLAS